MSRAIHRREFLARSTAFASGAIPAASVLNAPRSARAVSPNDKITLGIVGIRGRGYALSTGYQRYVDPALRGPRAAGVEKAQGKAPKTVRDFRRILDDKSVDAIVVATPDHWHAPATVWSCQAGEDVYVEKPASHTPWEGRKMVEAARKYKRVVQVGTQTRSAPYLFGAKRFLDEGKLGKIHIQSGIAFLNRWLKESR